MYVEAVKAHLQQHSCHSRQEEYIHTYSVSYTFHLVNLATLGSTDFVSSIVLVFLQLLILGLGLLKRGHVSYKAIHHSGQEPLPNTVNVNIKYLH